MVRTRNQKKSYQMLTNKETGAQIPISDNILPQGDLRAELVRVPNPISFNESLEK